MAIFITKKDKDLSLKISKILSKEYEVDVQELFGKKREHHITKVRFMAWYTLKNNYEMSFSKIARIFDRDHSSIIYGIKKAESLGLHKDL